MSRYNRYYSALVNDNNDPEKRGRLMLEIPELLDVEGEDGAIWPDWVEPRIAGGVGAPIGAGMFWIPPNGSIVVVEMEGNDPNTLRWQGGTIGDVQGPPSFLLGNYPKRAGWSAPSGGSVMALDDDSGAYILVSDAGDDDGTSPRTYLAINREGTVQIGTSAGSNLVVQEENIAMLDSSGHLLQLDGANNQIMIVHRDGAELIALSAGVAKLNGTAVQISGGSIELGDGVAPALHPYVLSMALLSAIDALATDVIAIGAGIPALVAVPAPGAVALKAGIAASLGAGAPYLSTIVKGS